MFGEFMPFEFGT